MTALAILLLLAVACGRGPDPKCPHSVIGGGDSQRAGNCQPQQRLVACRCECCATHPYTDCEFRPFWCRCKP